MKFIAVVLFLGSVLAADWSVTRRSDVTFDGTKLTLVEGEERDIPCQHSPGKTHHVRVDQGKTYQFNGFGVHFDFDSTLAVQVDSKGESSIVKCVHPSGSHFILQVLNQPGEDDPIPRFEAATLKSLNATDVVRTPAKLIVAGEELKGSRVDCSTVTMMKAQFSFQFFWKPVGKGGRMVCFARTGQNTEAVDAAFATIEKSLRFDKE